MGQPDVSGMIEPVRRRLARVDARALGPWEPAVTFDALRAAGEPRPALRPGPTPARGDGRLARWGAALRRGDLSPVELARRVLAAIDAAQPTFHTFITVDADGALGAAARAERELAAGVDRGPLHGLPVAVKDIIDTAGVRTTGGSRLLAERVPAADAFVVRRLRSAGAVIVGKANTHEFAAGPTGENPHYGSPENPWARGRVAGGSSSGSAVAVSLGLVAAALGSDTGGSVRIPAACCGVVGIKPTYGRVSRFGVLPLSWSLDHVGPLAETVGDAAALLGVLAGHDPADPASADLPVPDFGAGFAAAGSLRGVRVGIPGRWLEAGVQAGVRAAFERALRQLVALGAQPREVDLPAPDELAPLNRAIAFAEGTALHWADLLERPDLYGPDVRVRKLAGREVTAVQYLQAQRLRAELCRRVGDLLRDEVDVLATPTLPVVAPELGSALGYGADLIRFTSPVNLVGLPAVSLPCGFADAAGGPAGSGLPVALQLVGRAFAEPDLVRVALAYEQARGPWPEPPAR